MGRGWDGPEIVGLLRELDATELVLERGSVGLAFEAEVVRANHFVGREKKLEMPEGEAERVKEGKEGDGLIAGGPGVCGETDKLLDVFDGCTRRGGISKERRYLKKDLESQERLAASVRPRPPHACSAVVTSVEFERRKDVKRVVRDLSFNEPNEETCRRGIMYHTVEDGGPAERAER